MKYITASVSEIWLTNRLSFFCRYIYKAIIYETEDLGRSGRSMFTLPTVNVKNVNEDYVI